MLRWRQSQLISGEIKGSDKPWENEPNRYVFSYKGYRCLIRRTDLKILCGYVGIPPCHKYYGKSADELQNIDCHGGLTFSDRFKAEDAGEQNLTSEDNDGYWYIGFDAAHAWDLVPYMVEEYGHHELFQHAHTGTYKDMNYMIEQCKKIVDQL